MKLQRIVFVLVMVISMLCARAYSQTGKSAKSTSTPESVNAFLGRWDLTLKAPDREYPSWLELRQAGRTTEGPDCEPLGKRTAASQSCPLERTPYFRFSQRGRRTARRYGLRRNARREDVVGDHDWAKWNSLAVDRPEGASSKSRKCPEVGEADSLV